jgi:N-acetyl-gamma-glutamyl-phosphate reductase
VANQTNEHVQTTKPETAPATVTVGIVGGSGYSGTVLAELVLAHPAATLAQMSSERLAGEPVAAHLPRLRTDLHFTKAAQVGDVDVAFVCTPHGEAAPVVARLLAGGARVIDLSADFRLPPEQYAAWYGPHAHPELAPAVYGLTELHRAEIAAAKLVANPGCYPTAAVLALTPLLTLGLQDVIIDAKSGVTGAGATPSERTHFCTVADDLVAYGVGAHRHYPEIANAIGAAADAPPAGCEGKGNGDGNGVHQVAGGAAWGDLARAVARVAGVTGPSLTFVPHLIPVKRGITETIYVRAARLPSAAALHELYAEAYDGEPFVQLSAEPPRLADVVGTNVCRLFATVDQRAGRIIVISVIDNLMKGAAGQALQNMNVMLGLPETKGLL